MRPAAGPPEQLLPAASQAAVARAAQAIVATAEDCLSWPRPLRRCLAPLLSGDNGGARAFVVALVGCYASLADGSAPAQLLKGAPEVLRDSVARALLASDFERRLRARLPEPGRLWQVAGPSRSRPGGAGLVAYSDRAGCAERKQLGRLSAGAVLEELALMDGQLQFRCLAGDGPEFGWASAAGEAAVRLARNGGASGPGLQGVSGPFGQRLWRVLRTSSAIPCPITGRLYCPHKFAGITFFVEDGCFQKVPGLEEQLRTDSEEIERILPQHAFKEICASVAVWINERLEYSNKTDTEDMHSGLISHWGSRWATSKGDLAAKSGCVEFLRASGFMSCVKKAPALLLHELSHCYHNLKQDTVDGVISEAYDKAMKSGRYEKLGDHWKLLRYTALKDHYEFFAESSEAFFSSQRFHNECIPYLHEELEMFDPTAFAMCEQVWGIRGKDVVSREEFPERWQERVVFGEGPSLDYSSMETWMYTGQAKG